MNRFATSGPVWIVPARVAAALERELDLNEFRVRMRGRDREFDEVMLAGHAVAVQWVDEVREQAQFRDAGTVRDTPRNSPEAWDANEVAARTNCTARGVRKAATASPPQLVGSRDPTGRWWFTPEDVAQWAATRAKR